MASVFVVEKKIIKKGDFFDSELEKMRTEKNKLRSIVIMMGKSGKSIKITKINTKI